MPGLLALLIAGFGIVAMWSLPFSSILRDFSCDDSFYFSEIARRLATTGRSSFDGITSTNGYQPLWLWLEVPIFWLGLEDATAIRLTRCVEVLLGLLGFLALASGARRAGIRPWLLPMLLPFFVSTWVLYIGMEAGASVASICLATFLAVRFGERGGRSDAALLGIALAVCVFARLDNLAFATVVAGLLTATGSRSRSARVTLLVLTFAPILVYMTWNWLAFGSPVPVSGLVKQLWSDSVPDQGLERFGRRMAQMWGHRTVREGAIAAALVGVAGLVIARRARGARQAFAIAAIGLAALAVAKIAYYTATVEPPFATYSWYFATSRLLRFVAVLGAAAWVAHLLPQRIRDARWPGIVVMLVVGLMAGRDLWKQAERVGNTEPDWEILSWHGAEWLDANVGDDEVVGSFDAGVLGYFSDHAVVNLDGLVQSHDFYRRRKAGVPLVDELDGLGVTVIANCIVDPEHFFNEKGFLGAAERWQLVYRDAGRRALIEGEWRSFAVFRRR